MKPRLLIYGTGGHGNEIAQIALHLHKKDELNVLGHIDDNISNAVTILGLPVKPFDEALREYENCSFIVAIGSPIVREKVTNRLSSLGLSFLRLTHPSVEICDSTHVNEGCVIFSGCTLSVNVTLQNHVHVNTGTSISHDSYVDQYSTISPGVRICGNVHIGKRVFIGAGAIIVNGTPENKLKIVDDVYIAAGACVTKSLTIPGMYAGVPAKLKKAF